MKLRRDQIEQVVKEYLITHREIVFAYLFGSVAESDSFEDIDVGVFVSGSERTIDWLGYALALSGDLERIVRCRVDVIVMNTAPDHLIHNISKGIVVVNNDGDARIEFITAAWSRYFDFAPKRQQWLDEVVGVP